MSMTSMIRGQIQVAEQNTALEQVAKQTDQPTPPPLADNEKQVSNALDALSKYIPSESIALYLAAASAMPALKAVSQDWITPALVYWFFVVLTPVLFVLIFLGEMRKVTPDWKTLFSVDKLKEFSWWKVIASTFAFGFWALAVPTAPYLTSNEGRVVAALMAVFASTIISIIGTIVDPPSPKS